jgi:integrase
VYVFAIRKGFHNGGNPAREVKGEIVVPKTQNNRHIKEGEIPDFLKAVENRGTEQTKLASRLLLLTFVRKQELLGAKWTELDLERGVWEIPAERMKNDSPHIVPLSRQALECFKKLKAVSGKGEFVFPNKKRPKAHMGG